MKIRLDENLPERLVAALQVLGHDVDRVISWTRGGVAVWIVSDLALTELDDFGRTLDAAMHD